MTGLFYDLRLALRSLRRSPGFTVAVLATLAIGIGANTAIFTLVYGALLRPLPFPRADRLVGVWGSHAAIGRETASLPDFLDWRGASRRVEDMAALTYARYNLAGDGEPEVVRGALVTANLFRLLGLAPAAGRSFSADEERSGAARVVILSDGLWRRRFGADAGVLGRPLLLSGVPHTVIGVAPASLRLQREVDLWTPLTTDTTMPRRADFLTVIGRLRADATLAQAQEELRTIARRLEGEYPGTNTGWSVELIPLQDQLVAGVRPALLVFMAAVAVVLLIACANVANLMLTRVAGRRRELAIRVALGASRRHLVRQILTESTAIALAAGGAGLLLAVWGVAAIRALDPAALPRTAEVGIDRVVLGFTVGLSLLTGLLFGLIPALGVARRDLRDPLVGRSRGVLVLAEVALAFMLSISAALLLRSFTRLQQVDPGFEAEGSLTARLSLPRAGYPEPAGQVAFAERLLERLRATPGVSSAGLVSAAPLRGGAPYWSFVVVDEEPPAPGVVQDAVVYMSSPDYFPTVGISLVAGRLFDATDHAGAPPVALVSETLARRYWGGRTPLDRRISFGDPADRSSWVTVVGVVRDVRPRSLVEPAHPQVYLPFAQAPTASFVVAVRGAGEPLARLPVLKQRVAELDPTLPISEVATLDQVVAAALAPPRVNAMVVGGFALVALGLAAIGIYGVIAYGVVQRTRELGIRVALGAGHAQLRRLVLGRGMAPVLGGLVLGGVGALAGGRMLRSLLFGIGPTDPSTFGLVAGVLLTVALAAGYLPARRVADADPMVALRSE